MRFGSKYELDRTEKTFFAWFPVTIKKETRWLEKITVRGSYEVSCFTGTLYWVNYEFIDKV